MKHWRAVLEIRSPLATPLTAARLFGHVCWGLAWREGPQAVTDFLARMAGEDPPLVLAAPSPVDFSPMPVVLQDGSIAPDVPGRRRDLWSLYRRSGLMPRAALLNAAGDLSPGGLRRALDDSGWPRPLGPRRGMRVRSGARRPDGAPIGAAEWLAVEYWQTRRPGSRHADRPAQGSGEAAGQVEMVVAGSLEAVEIERLLRMGLEHGVGRAAGVGYGQIELLSLEALDWPQVADANALVTLGPCVPRRTDPPGGAWRVQVHWGRVGAAMAAEGISVEKRPVLELSAGAVLAMAVAPGRSVAARGPQASAWAGGQAPGVNESHQRPLGLESRTFAGRLVAGVHPQRSEVVHYGLAPVLAVKGPLWVAAEG